MADARRIRVASRERRKTPFDRQRVPTNALAAIVMAGALAIGVALLARHGESVAGWFGHVLAHIAAAPPSYVVAACALKALEVILNTRAWVAVLAVSHPEQGVRFRQALGVVQGGIGIGTVVPPKLSGIPILALYRAAFPRLGIADLIGTRTVQGLAATILGLVVLLVFGASSIGNAGQTFDRVATFYRTQPLVAIAVTILVSGLLVHLVRRGRARVRAFALQVARCGAILRSPGRYALLVAAPTVLAFGCRWGVTGVLMTAFDLPVTLETLVRVNISHGLARSVQVAPGGLGTTQAFDLVALQGVAPAVVITAYSLAQGAILLVFNIAFAFGALAWAFGWERTVALLSRRSTRPA